MELVHNYFEIKDNRYSKTDLLPRQHATHKNRIHTSQYPKCHIIPPHKRLINKIYHDWRSPMRLKGTQSNTHMSEPNTKLNNTKQIWPPPNSYPHHKRTTRARQHPPLENTAHYLSTPTSQTKQLTTPATTKHSNTQNSRPPRLAVIPQYIQGPGLLFFKDILREPNATFKEILMGFQPGAKTAPGFSESDRCQILGQTPDL